MKALIGGPSAPEAALRMIFICPHEQVRVFALTADWCCNSLKCLVEVESEAQPRIHAGLALIHVDRGKELVRARPYLIAITC
jgi:hypothetical protein